MFTRFLVVELLKFYFLFFTTNALKIDHDGIDEGACNIAYETWPDIRLFKLMLATPTDGWMVPMSSKHLAYHIALHLTSGNSSWTPQLSEDINQMCIRVNQHGISAKLQGKPAQSMFKCNYSKIESVYCFSTAAHVQEHEIGPFKITLAWTDNQKHILMVFCGQEAHQKYWALVSSSATVDSATKTKVLGFISDLEFDPGKTLYHNYAIC